MDKNLKLEVLKQISALASAGFGLVAALAWNEAIQKLFEAIFGKQSNLIAMFAYAVFITIIVVVISMQLGKMTNRLTKDNGQK
ncbi:hypothetical protein GYA54_03345 [Candidatus Kuenenbacteria bacterium]|nr:hypothetical protein [Candidatus Kuenenbacteria bacterium]